jgi:hypothetical protein
MPLRVWIWNRRLSRRPGALNWSTRGKKRVEEKTYYRGTSYDYILQVVI